MSNIIPIRTNTPAPILPFPGVDKVRKIIYVKRVSQEQLKKLMQLGYTVVLR